MGTLCTTTSFQVIMLDTTFDTATSSLMTKCIEQAENKVKEMLARRYDTSSIYFTTYGEVPVLTTLCEWLATGLMYENMSRGGKDSYMRADRYIKKAMENLKLLRDEETSLVDDEGNEVPESDSNNAVFANTYEYVDTFDEGNPLDWQTDPNKLEDISNEKN